MNIRDYYYYYYYDDYYLDNKILKGLFFGRSLSSSGGDQHSCDLFSPEPLAVYAEQQQQCNCELEIGWIQSRYSPFTMSKGRREGGREEGNGLANPADDKATAGKNAR